MLDTLVNYAELLAAAVLSNFAKVLVYPLSPNQRIYWLYLASSAATALGLWWLRRRPGEPSAGRSFLRFCFPTEVWSHPSAWLDVRYFFFHQILRVWMYTGLAVSITLATVELLDATLAELLPAAAEGVTAASLADRILLTVVGIALLDLGSFAAHVLQHRIPLLWEFHRVHHSPPVLQPLSNYREHPVDNLLYTVVNGVGLGVLTSGAAWLLGCEYHIVDVLGINAFLFAFNLLGYNLRHSHIWLAWPGWLGYAMGSPAYHQIHHSTDPRHWNRNFGFLFPAWDWLFGSLYLPSREPERLRFGLGDGTEDQYDSVLRLYTLPFARLLGRRRSGEALVEVAAERAD